MKGRSARRNRKEKEKLFKLLLSFLIFVVAVCSSLFYLKVWYKPSPEL